MTHPYIELGPEHVGKSFIKAFNRVWMVNGFMGRILPGDVGKRVYFVDDDVQVENDEQRDIRKNPKPMTLREASEIIERLQHRQFGDEGAVRALMRAKQALDILATLEEGVSAYEAVTVEHNKTRPEYEWTATMGHRTHLGVSLSDALGQLCQTLENRSDEDR